MVRTDEWKNGGGNLSVPSVSPSAQSLSADNDSNIYKWTGARLMQQRMSLEIKALLLHLRFKPPPPPPPTYWEGRRGGRWMRGGGRGEEGGEEGSAWLRLSMLRFGLLSISAPPPFQALSN